MASWTVTQLTHGTAEGRYHSHSYYDIPVMDRPANRVLAHRVGFVERQPVAADPVEVGIVGVRSPGEWAPLGTSRAWSWQQGPMAQWVGGGPAAVYNDREDGAFVARLVDVDAGARRTLPRPVYAVSPAGDVALSLNMARLDTLRPGYGYPEGSGARLEERAPRDDGVWRMDLATGEARLVLSLAEAKGVLMRWLGPARRLLLGLRAPHFWFNHAKVSPDGRRFTVKLRWRVLGKGWNDRQGVSLTAAMDGGDVRVLTNATSHVIWLNDRQLYAWRLSELALFADDGGRSNRVARLAPELVTANVHMRHLPPGATAALGEAVFDTPYRETVDLVHCDARTGAHEVIASFANHRPARGPFRCDLHPCPSEDGRTVIVTSMNDGGRQVYAVARTG